MLQCPCGSGKSYTACCEPYIKGIKKAATAETLMRSRYTAYTKSETGYIESTHDPDTRASLDLEETRKWAGDSRWQGLEIISTEGGGPEESEGKVEFKARYTLDGEEIVHHELSHFVKHGGTWYFNDGHTPSTTFIRESPKVGRNDPCPCGSGKKYKKCCG